MFFIPTGLIAGIAGSAAAIGIIYHVMAMKQRMCEAGVVFSGAC